MPPELNGPWQAYRLWANTARYNKRIIDLSTSWSLALAIGGAIAATLAEQFKAEQFKPLVWLGTAATGAIALAAFFSQQAQSNNRVSMWARSRSAAESLKSTIFLYRADAPPFDSPDHATQLLTRTDNVITHLEGIAPREPKAEHIPELGSLTVDLYITERVQNQIKYYKDHAGDNQRKADACRWATTILMGVGALLTALSMSKAVSVWAPVVATITAAITAHLKNNQYQTLTATYSATALRLTLLLNGWQAAGKTDADKPERNAFIQRCEETMLSENGGWSGLWKT